MEYMRISYICKKVRSQPKSHCGQVYTARCSVVQHVVRSAQHSTQCGTVQYVIQSEEDALGGLNPELRT
eukprot:9494868-Pyramimonas_sp.AAC.2